MRGTKLALCAGVASCAFLGGAVSAHHGVTNYDMKKTVILMGTVTAFEWSNPHCLTYLDVTDDTGHVRHWTLEMSSTSIMARRGWNKDVLKRGDQATVEVHPAANGASVAINSGPGFALRVVVNGKELQVR